LQDGVATYRRVPGMTNPSVSAGFVEFVEFLASGGLEENGHWAPQLSLLALSPERFDYLIHLENFSAHFVAMAQDLGFEPGHHLYDGPHHAEGRVKTTDAATQLISLLTSDVKAQVDMLYRRDFIAFGYEEGFNLLPWKPFTTPNPAASPAARDQPV
jgi:hypothetical protein